MPRAAPALPDERSSRAVSAARTMVASRNSGGVARPNSSTITSKVQSSPRWLQNTFSISKGTALKRSPTPDHFGRRHEQEHRVGIDEPPDQPGAGDAVDLRPRPGDPDGAALRVARRQFRRRHQRQLGGLPALETAFERFGLDMEHAAARPRCPARASGRAGRRRWPSRPENSSPQSAASSWMRLTAPGISRGSAAKSSSVRTSISAGIFAVPIRRASLSGDIVVGDDMDAPSQNETGRDTWACRLMGGSQNPHEPYYSETGAGCQCASAGFATLVG